MSNNGSAPRSAVRSGPFFIQIDGLPPGYTWQQLKDLIRSTSTGQTHGVWTDIAINFRGQPYPEKGRVRMKLYSEAVAAYTHLIQQNVGGRPLCVELWDITAPPPYRIARNYATENSNSSNRLQEVARIAQDQSWVPISPMSSGSSASLSSLATSMAQMSIASSPMQAAQSYYPQAVLSTPQTQQQGSAYYTQAQLAALQNAQIRARQAIVDQQRVQVPAYATTSSGLPVNVRNGVAVTEPRAIFVSKLSYKAKEREVYDHFARAGKIVSCKVQKDSRTHKPRGFAQIEYATAADAQRAIDAFDDQEFMGMTLHVRHDKDTTTISPPPRSDSRPLIVTSSMGNGSR